MTPAVRAALAARLKREEGEKRLPNGNHALYKDSKGISTIGWGYNVEANGLPDDIAEELLGRTVSAAERAAEGVPGYLAADPVRQSVVVAMCFQMGLGKVLRFKNFCAHFAAGAYNAAADEMLDSNWCRYDSPARANREAAIMRTGILP
jgi:GH24 family phage-related lysozyme (muramidase)